MSDAAIFVAAFLGLFVLRVALATLVFFWILPRSDRCPDCNAVTIRLEPAGARRLFPWFRYSWCLRCGWRGALRTPEQPSPERAAPIGQHSAPR